jgi:hypothetical protein
LARGLDCGSEGLEALVAIAEHEVRRPFLEQLDDGHRTDIAAVEHDVYIEAFEHAHGRPG